MHKPLLLLTAALLLCAACQKTADTTSTATSNDTTATATSDTVAPVTAPDTVNGSAKAGTMSDTIAAVQGAATTSKTAADAGFILQAAQGGMMEVELGKMAQVKGNDPAVKEIGGMMVKDHSSANDELKAIVTKKDVKLPPTLSPEGQAIRNRLAKLMGKDFDRLYIDEMVKAHQHDIGAFEKEAGSGQDPDIKAFAGKTLPTLQMHAEMLTKQQKKQML